MYDLLIRGGNAVLPGTDGVPADIAVSNGKIAGILAPGSGAEAREILDASGLVVFPGVIDVHLHLGHGQDIARPRVPEDAAGETAAAAVGGVTTFDSLSDGDGAVRGDLRRCARRDRGRRPDRLQLSLHHLDRGPARRRAALCARHGRAVVQDFHEQPGRGGQAPRPAGHRRRLPVPAVRGRGRARRAGLPASREHRGRLGAARPADRRRIRMGAAGSRPGTPADRRFSKPMRCSAPACSRGRPGRGSTSSTPRRDWRWRRAGARARPVPTSRSRPARTI